MKKLNNKGYLIDGLYVETKYRNKGIATSLIEKALTLLKDLNIFSEESLQDVESTLNQLKEKIKNIDVKEILSKLSKIFGEDIEEKIKELDFEKNIEELKDYFLLNIPFHKSSLF